MRPLFGLSWCESEGLRWLSWQGAGVGVAFPTRAGGGSPPPWHTLNLGLSVGDEPARVLENRGRLLRVLGLRPERLVVPQQVHGAELRWVGEEEAGRGAASAGDAITSCDGLLTATPGLGLAVSTADCLAIVIVARGTEGLALAAVHAGWRGVLQGLAGQAAAELSRRGELLGAVIGPSIGPCCFVVDDDLRARFAARFAGVSQRRTVDLWAAARADLLAHGVPAEGLTVTGICTSCDPAFFSHRRDSGLTGRHLAIAWLRGRVSNPGAAL